MATVSTIKPNYKKCDLCKISTKVDDVCLFGDWMESKNIQVHYFCLLLSTNLNQNGKIFSEIGGFLLCDIRKAIKVAKHHACCYCNNLHASISCNNCMDFFHMVCGRRENCLFQFDGYFYSYCNKCLILVATPYDLRLTQKPPSPQTRCYICCESLGRYKPTNWIYGKCCGNGFVHRSCMQGYALMAGYYLRCIWCQSQKFRSLIRLQGIFVPDRDAIWEGEPGAYRELYRSELKCNMPVCLCRKGADFTSREWPLTKCVLCGSFGAHNPYCITGKLKRSTRIENYKCEICLKTEQCIAGGKTLINETAAHEPNDVVFVYKKAREENLDDYESMNVSITDDESSENSEKENHVETECDKKSLNICITDDESSEKSEKINYVSIFNENDSIMELKAINIDNWETLKTRNHEETLFKIKDQLKDSDEANANWISYKSYTFEEKNRILQCTGSATIYVNTDDRLNITIE